MFQEMDGLAPSIISSHISHMDRNTTLCAVTYTIILAAVKGVCDGFMCFFPGKGGHMLANSVLGK